MPIFLALFAIPLLEIATFIAVGGQIGIAATLGLTLLTALAGTILLRRQGLATIQRIRSDLQADRVPARPLADGAMIAIAGIFLLTPGFLTDLAGLLLFVPTVRDFIWSRAKSRISVAAFDNGHPSAAHSGRDEATVIDLDDSDFMSRPDPDSPWQNSRGA